MADQKRGREGPIPLPEKRGDIAIRNAYRLGSLVKELSFYFIQIV